MSGRNAGEITVRFRNEYRVKIVQIGDPSAPEYPTFEIHVHDPQGNPYNDFYNPATRTFGNCLGIEAEDLASYLDGVSNL